jgi:hypothetical protein
MWQPIETAPRDGSWFMIWAHGKPEVGRYNPQVWSVYDEIEGTDMYRRRELTGYEWEGFNNFHAAELWSPVEPPK